MTCMVEVNAQQIEGRRKLIGSEEMEDGAGGPQDRKEIEWER